MGKANKPIRSGLAGCETRVCQTDERKQKHSRFGAKLRKLGRLNRQELEDGIITNFRPGYENGANYTSGSKARVAHRHEHANIRAGQKWDNPKRQGKQGAPRNKLNNKVKPEREDQEVNAYEKKSKKKKLKKELKKELKKHD